MDRTEIHELSAAYALDALGPEELDEFERHLAHCTECREHVASFQEAVAELAYDVDAPAPSPALRNRVLADARREQPKVVAMPRRRWAFPVAAAAAFAAGCVALGLAFWASDLAQQLDDERAALHRADEVVIALSDPTSSRIPLDGANGILVVDARLVRGLGARERPRRGARGKDVRGLGHRGRRGGRRRAVLRRRRADGRAAHAARFPRARSSPSRSRRPEAWSSPRRTRSS